MANVGKVWNGTAWVDLGSTATFQSAGTATVGVVQLTDSTSSTSTTTAATPNSVKSAYDLAGTAIPKNTVTAAGDILYASGSATVTRLGIGTANQVLSVSAGVPSWTTPSAGGGMTIIGTATPSGATSLGFSSIPTTYKHLLLIWFGVFQSAVDVGWGVRFNNDSGSAYTIKGVSTSTGTSWLAVSGSGKTLLGGSYSDSPITASGTSASDNAQTVNGSMIIWNYTNTGERLAQWTTSGYRSVGYPWSSINGLYKPSSGSAITQIDFIRESTQTITGTVYLYGVS